MDENLTEVLYKVYCPKCQKDGCKVVMEYNCYIREINSTSIEYRCPICGTLHKIEDVTILVIGVGVKSRVNILGYDNKSLDIDYLHQIVDDLDDMDNCDDFFNDWQLGLYEIIYWTRDITSDTDCGREYDYEPEILTRRKIK
jgi:hypothetical protein